MAASKNNNTNADSTGGFKTVAFGFDKNDVTMYIASLRKKMKQMEEEFQDKLKEALDNPAASNEAMKHEREVIRSEMEKMWGDKLNERNQILKQQQGQINELEETIQKKDGIIESLKAELSAANAQDGDSREMNARAAKAYVQFTSELRSITGSLQNTLQNIEKTWRSDFEDAINEIQTVDDEKVRINTVRNRQAEITAVPIPADGPESVSKSAYTTVSASVVEAELAQEETPEENKLTSDNEAAKKKTNSSKKAVKESSESVSAAEPAKMPFEPFDFGDEDNDPLKGIIADISDDTPLAEPNTEHEPAKRNKSYPKETAIDSGISEEKSVEANITYTNEIIEETTDDISDDFGDLGDLLAEPVPKPATAKKQTASTSAKATPPAPKIDIDDDLSALLADDPANNDIKAKDEIVGATNDFADLLAEGSGKPDFGEDIIITEDEPTQIKGDDLDVSLLSDMVIVPGDKSNGDLDQMLKEQAANEYAQFGDLFVAPAGDDETIGFQNMTTDNSDDEADLVAESDAASKKDEKNEDDLFDFSFLSPDTDDEDDMSTDASFPGML